MKKKSRENGRFTQGAVTGALLIFIALCLGTGLGTISNLLDPGERSVVVGELAGQKAFAGEQDVEEAMMDSMVDTDTLFVVDTTAAPGDTFWLTVSLTNDSIPVAGFSFWLEYNASMIYPDTIMTNPCGPDSLCTLLVIEGYETERTAQIPGKWWVWGGRLLNNHLDTLKFNCLAPFDVSPYPHLPAGGSGPVVRFKFVVRPEAQPGDTTGIRFFYWDPDPNVSNYANTLTDTIGADNFIPRTRNGIFTVSGGGPGDNHCPVFTFPESDFFQVNEGVTLEFDVTATDEDGDTITLTMDPLDPDGLNYNFVPQIGEAVVTSRFDYTPAYDEYPATRYVRFRATDGQCPVTKTVEIKVLETAQDLLMASSLQGGVPGARDRLTPFMITNSVDIYGFQFTFSWDPAKLYVDSLVPTDALQGFSVWDNLEDSVSAGNATILVFGLGGETIPAGLDTVIYPAFRVLEDAEPGPVDISIYNAREAINPGYPSQPLGAVDGIFMIDRFGDANLDTWVDVGDVVSLVAYINDSISFTPRQESAADVNQDSDVNVGDLVAMIDIILGSWMGPSPPMYPGPMAFIELDYQDLQPGSSGEIRVMANLEVPVAAAQLQINYDPDKVTFEVPALSERSGHFLIQHRDDGNGKLHLVLFNMSNDPIAVGEGNILSLPVTLSPGAEGEFGIELKEIALADEKAALIPVGDEPTSRPVAFELGQNYPNPFNPSTTIKFTLPSPGDGGITLPTNLRIYNVLGEVVRTLVDEPMVPGVHHEVWDGKDDQGSRVASGIYFYRLRSSDFVQTKKMVLMK
ncbi:MAG: FlgD immunoglobulin-like domain containing protein [Candidatus Zixiibacteriota bacterium]